jgi:AAA15 family ATPase/GTPase
MKLKSFTVERYRSITKAKKIRLGRVTVLVGPNNEGKSNLLRSLRVMKKRDRSKKEQGEKGQRLAGAMS